MSLGTFDCFTCELVKQLSLNIQISTYSHYDNHITVFSRPFKLETLEIEFEWNYDCENETITLQVNNEPNWNDNGVGMKNLIKQIFYNARLSIAINKKSNFMVGPD